MRRATTLAAVAFAVLVPACKKKTPEPVKEEESAVADRSGGRDGAPLLRQGAHRRVEILCEELECTKEQILDLRELFDELGPSLRPAGRRDPHPDANAKLAQAFAGDTFDATALVTYRSQLDKVGNERQREHQAAVAKALGKIHALLDDNQRETFAMTVREAGLHLLSGRARMTAAMRARQPDPERRATRIAERLCETLACSVDQENKLIDALKKLPAPNEDEPESAREALATAFTGPELDKAAIDAFLNAAQQADKGREAQRDPVWVEIHGLLTPEQRKQLADDIETRGMGAIGGGGGRFRPGRHARGR